MVEALGLDLVVLVGNSLGGPVGLSAAAKLSGIAKGLIAIDTLQDVDREWPREDLLAYVQSLRDDFRSTCKVMVRQLLLEGTDEALYAWIAGKICSFDPAEAPHVVEGFVDYDLAQELASAEIPIRAILGDVTSLDLDGNRALRPDLDAVVIEGCGHYPILE